MSQDITSLYTEGDYLDANPAWHSERSPWKAAQVHRGLQAVGLEPKSVCDIGCGTGLALAELSELVPSIEHMVGFEPSPDAPVHPKAEKVIDFRREDASASKEVFDLSLMLDVFEHVEDYIGFLRSCHHLAEHHAFHIPLDANLRTLLGNGFATPRKALGHLHYFSSVSALATLKHCGYEPIHWHFTKAGWEGPPSKRNRRNKWSPMNISRRMIHLVSPDYAHRILGGLSLLVIAKATK